MMLQIPPIEDTYIDGIIKSEGPFNPDLNKTQGVKLRELVKLLRDRLEQEIEAKPSAESEKEWFKFQIAMTGETEQAILMEYAGQIDSSMLGGCNSLKLKIGVNGTYTSGEQGFPFAFSAGDRVFFTINYGDLMFAKCNVILKGKYSLYGNL